MDQNYMDPNLNNKALMDKFYITERTLIDTFKDEFGETPHRYLINLRMKEAKRLLQIEKKTPTEVSVLVGYDNFRSFRTQFVKTFGFPPSEYR
ncbi:MULTISPECIES: AraC family transcriptional regulator [Sphingobacterium]|uniref:helix-turn-helix domain-containing protein n=1 Tax=Sphingobacterium TaxID=28453 RepID=UPI0015D4AE6B|nr:MULTISPECIES: helix-turn-helix domain-containing protein [Sphingobacterium]MCT1530844.1 helix-turn-helix domain-containing protein [Sphingobacterium daejeonense]